MKISLCLLSYDLRIKSSLGNNSEVLLVFYQLYSKLSKVTSSNLILFKCFRSRRTPASAESSILSVAIYNTIFGVIGGTLVHFFYDGPKSTNYAIVGGITFWVIFLTLLLILIMKVRIWVLLTSSFVHVKGLNRTNLGNPQSLFKFLKSTRLTNLVMVFWNTM